MAKRTLRDLSPPLKMTDLKEGFTNHLKYKYSHDRAGEILEALEIADLFLVEHRIIRGVFSVSNLNQIAVAIDVLRQSADFRLKYKNQLSNVDFAFREYVGFLKRIPPDSLVTTAKAPEQLPKKTTQEKSKSTFPNQSDYKGWAEESEYVSDSKVIERVFSEVCGKSAYGITIAELQRILHGVDAKTIEKVLKSAPWARKKYSRWVYCSGSHIAEQKQKPTVAEKSPMSVSVQPTATVNLSENEAPRQAAKENSLVPKMEEIVLKADMEGMSYNELRDSLQISMAQTKQIVAESECIVDVKGRLIHEDAFIDWEDGADALETILDKLMQKNNGYISIGQLFEYARAEMNMFLNDNDICDERSVYDIARHLFEKAHYHDKHYSFVGHTHISRSNEKICSNLDLFKKYAADQGGVFRYTGLTEYLESVGVSTGNLKMQMRLYTESIFFNYDEDILISSEGMNMDEVWKEAVNEALKALFEDVGDHIVLRRIPGIWYDCLPMLPGSRPWTPLLLQSILRFYSKEFNAHTIQAMDGQSIETLHTMLVENDSPIQNFGDVVISFLLENEIEQRQFKTEDLRGGLVDADILHGNELIWNMPKALKGDNRFAWDVKGENVTVMI